MEENETVLDDTADKLGFEAVRISSIFTFFSFRRFDSIFINLNQEILHYMQFVQQETKWWKGLTKVEIDRYLNRI